MKVTRNKHETIIIKNKQKNNDCKNNLKKYRKLFNEEKDKKEYYKIWDKVCNLIKKGIDSERMYNQKYLKTKIKSHDDKINFS